jgi:hypothetical protein
MNFWFEDRYPMSPNFYTFSSSYFNNRETSMKTPELLPIFEMENARGSPGVLPALHKT